MKRRTTMTLDEDNALRLTRLRQERDASLKEVVNEVIRRGLDEAEKPFRREPFQTRAMHLGPLLYPDLKQAMEAIQDEEDLRKLGLK
ncbi:MAG TPA: hypothetical protein VNU97_03745 [Rhizomicrobium sp.]|jgi:hypothetical protein|nr:hypothetical protein [Rhizomicrobium sp.]